MIKFFRNIRKKLLGKGKTGKYFKYAIGEILLVVIGILIALQINNWNEYRKERNLEGVLLSKMLISLENDTIKLNSEKKIFERILKHGRLLRNAINKDLPFQESMNSSFALINTFTINEADYTTYDRIKDVGIEIILNDSIKDALTTYYKRSKWVAKIENGEISDIFMQRVYPKFFKSFAYAQYAVPKDFDALKKESEFIIHLDYCINDAKWYLKNNKQRKKMAIHLISLLKNKLAND